MRRSTVESLTLADINRMKETHVRGEEQIKALRQQFHNFKDSYEDMNFTGPLLSTISARTLIIHGDRDDFFPVNIPMEMYRSIPHSYLWIVANGGHVPIYGTRKAEFLRITEEFFGAPGERKQ
jgi:pimeloyl-ACP methyl ester carboxylesterase